jgi:glycosyltransferase involved in cell wall biosynthesis
MMRSRGFEVIHYGTEGSESGANKDVQLFTRKEWHELRIRSLRHLKPELDSDEKAEAHLRNPQAFYGDLANWSTPLYEEFNRRFKAALLENYQNLDIVCIPLGRSYDDALSGLHCVILEFGIGYNGSCKNFRVFESHSWMSKTLTEEKKSPQNYWFVVPHSFNITEFPFSRGPTIPTVGFMARITNCKGANIVVEIAKRLPSIRFVLCGQGDPTPYLTHPNIVYKGSIHGDERGRFLGGLTAFLAPTTYLEPFGAAMVEAQLCGTPVICSDWGGMSETVEQWKTGLRCHTLADYCFGVQMALDSKFDRTYIRDQAVQKYDMYRVAKDYEYVIRSVLDVHNGRNGWYSPKSHMITDRSPDPPRIHLQVAYFGKAFPNYFQLYLDSLGNNADVLVLHLYTNITLEGYELPSNIRVEQMTFEELNQKISTFLNVEFGVDTTISPPILDHFAYKLCEFKVAYHDIFTLDITDDDYFGWGDIDVIYGKLSNFIDLSANYDRIGSDRGHFTALRNTEPFRKLYKNVPDILKTFQNNTYYEGTDEGKFPAILSKNDHTFPITKYICDIIPEQWNKRWLPKGSTATFYDTYDMTKNISHLQYSAKGLVVRYEDGETRDVAYVHLQKRAFPDPTCRYSYSIYSDRIVNE